MPIPPEIHNQSYINLTTFRKSGVGVPTPVWFGELNDRLYVMSRTISGKFKRIRNNSQVTVSACTIRGRVTGPEFSAVAQILPKEQWAMAKKTITSKYWLARVPFLWSRTDVYFEIEIGGRV